MDIEESKKSIINTVIYSDIFDYPLTISQLHTFLISKKSLAKERLEKIVKHMTEVKIKNAYVFLPGRESLITKRKENKIYSDNKLHRAKKTALLLSVIPTILFIGVSGGVAMHNAAKEDDIDLFIITNKQSVWMTRLTILFILFCLGKLRTRNRKQVADTFCVNMILSEDAIAFSKEKQNIYIAHEVVQVVPLIQRNNMYASFFRANQWVKLFLPHGFLDKKPVITITDSFMHPILFWIFTRKILERFAGLIQKNHMKKSITTETVQDNFLAFHPFDYAKNTLAIYNKRIHEKI